MGKQAASEVRDTIGFVDDADLQRYVSRVGLEEAKASERPDLPWEFHVVDDPAVNAFALPGGFIYVTRGLMNLMTSEAQLAGVLGHEIGHVTARDSVNQVSKQQLAQLGLGLGSILVPQTRPFGSLLGAGLDLLMLKYSRDDEREADALGFEYMRKQGYDVAAMADVFAALGRESAQQESGGLPGWLATHPASGERVQAAEQRATALGQQQNPRVGRNEFLRQIDNLVYGPDPREGFFRDAVFYHPKLKFRLDLPAGWKTNNARTAVVAVSPHEDAAMQLTLTADRTISVARERFVVQPGLEPGFPHERTIHGQRALLTEFRASTEQGVIHGLAGWIAYKGRVYQIIGYAPLANYGSYGSAFGRTIESFAPLQDRTILSIQPKRMDVVNLDESLRLTTFADRYDSAVPVEELAIINQVDSGRDTLPAGLAKRIVR